MKKVLFLLLAAAAMVGCSNEEVVELNKKEIAFGEAFVENATRADYSTDKSVTAFKVYGTVEPTAGGSATQIYNGANVTGTTYNTAWNCDVTQYWLPKSTYHFAAIVDGEAAATTALPVTIPFTLTTGDEDLLYATADETTDEAATPTTSTLVAFTFEHLLAKLQFTIENGTAPADKYSYDVTGVAVTGIVNKGVYTVAGKSWAKAGDATTIGLAFGETDDAATGVAGGATEVTSETHQILPVEQELVVTITYNTYLNGTLVAEGMTLGGTITSRTYQANTVYNVKATITGTAISFTVGTVGGWASAAGDITI